MIDPGRRRFRILGYEMHMIELNGRPAHDGIDPGTALKPEDAGRVAAHDGVRLVLGVAPRQPSAPVALSKA